MTSTRPGVAAPRLWFGVPSRARWPGSWLGSLAVGAGTRTPRDTRRRRPPRVLSPPPAHRRRDGDRCTTTTTCSGGTGQHSSAGTGRGFEATATRRSTPCSTCPPPACRTTPSFLIWTAIGLRLTRFLDRAAEAGTPGPCLPLGADVLPGVRHGQLRAEHVPEPRRLRRPCTACSMPTARSRPGSSPGLLGSSRNCCSGCSSGGRSAPADTARCWLGVGCHRAVTGGRRLVVVLPEASRAFVERFGRTSATAARRMWNKQTPEAFFEIACSRDAGRVYWGAGAGVGRGGERSRWRGGSRSEPGAPVAVMFPVAVFLSLWASPHALIYEWALARRGGRGAVGAVPGVARRWLCLFALAWVAGRQHAAVAIVQIRYLLPVVVQVSVPVLGLVGWR